MVFALLAALTLSSTNMIEIEVAERDLVEPARVEMLRAEIRRAARRVCDVENVRGLAARRAALECAGDAEARANAQLSQAVARAGVIEVAAN